MQLDWPELTLQPINLYNCPKQFWRDNMTLTTKDVNDRLRQISEVDLLEILDITSEDILDRFQDKIDQRRDYFEEDLED